MVESGMNDRLFPVTRFCFSYWKNFNETCHKYSSCEWALLRRF